MQQDSIALKSDKTINAVSFPKEQSSRAVSGLSSLLQLEALRSEMDAGNAMMNSSPAWRSKSTRAADALSSAVSLDNTCRDRKDMHFLASSSRKFGVWGAEILSGVFMVLIHGLAQNMR